MTNRYQLLPPLTADEWNDLRADIEAHGVQVPIIVDEDGNVLDGHHRQSIARALDVPCPETVVTGYSDAEKRDMALRLNLHRRSLTREQKRDLIAASLKADPQLSDRQHAERTGASPTTVGTVRSDLVEAGEVSNLDTRTDAKGVEQPAVKPSRFKRLHHDTVVDTETGEVIDPAATPQPAPVPDGYTTENPAAIAAQARREFYAEPWPVFTTKLLPALKHWSDWYALAEINGAAGILASLDGMPVRDGDEEDRAIRSLDRAAEWIAELRTALAQHSRKLRSVQ